MRELLDYPVSLGVACGCTRVLTARPGWITGKLGPDATAADAERRMRCKACGERPRLRISPDWGARLSWETRGAPPPCPEWALEGLE